MNENMFAKFNEMFGGEAGLAEFQKEVQSAGASNTEFVEVPHGNYEVKISKLELGQVTNEASANFGMPKVSVWFTILAGEFKNQKIFMTQLVHKPFGLHKMNELLANLETGVPVAFENWVQYGALLEEIFNEVDRNQYEYELAYTTNAKNAKFNDYTIVQKFN